MTHLNRKTLFSAGAAVLGTCGACAGLAVIAQAPPAADAPQIAQSAQDREKVDRELKELQDQRAKIDDRIRDLRRQSGRDRARAFALPDGKGRIQVWTGPGDKSLFFSDGKLKEMKELTPEQRKKVEGAMAEAKRALEKARKELPEGFVMPDVEGILDNALRMRTLAPGNVFVAPQAFDSKEFREQMEKMRDDIRKNVETYRLAVPKVYTVPPATTVRPMIPAVPPAPLFRGGNSPELRDEVRELRRELEQLREEIRRDRGGKKDSQDRKTQFLDPFGGSL